MPIVGLVLAVVAGYLIGAIPSGVIVGRLRGVDPRSGGSGRTGATNAMRTLGTGLAAVVLLADVAKGAVAVLLGAWLASVVGASDVSGAWGGAIGGVAAVIGHVRSIFIGFTGGRGVATGGGAMLVLAPLAVVIAVPVIVAAIALTRYVSLGSILAAATVAAASVVLHLLGWTGLGTAIAAIAIGAVVVVAHADNIDRLRAGTERRLGGG